MGMHLRHDHPTRSVPPAGGRASGAGHWCCADHSASLCDDNSGSKNFERFATRKSVLHEHFCTARNGIGFELPWPVRGEISQRVFECLTPVDRGETGFRTVEIRAQAQHAGSLNPGAPRAPGSPIIRQSKCRAFEKNSGRSIALVHKMRSKHEDTTFVRHESCAGQPLGELWWTRPTRTIGWLVSASHTRASCPTK